MLIVAVLVALILPVFGQTNWYSCIFVFGTRRRISCDCGKAYVGVCRHSYFHRIYNDLLVGSECETPLEKCVARCSICDCRMDFHFPCIFILCRKFWNFSNTYGSIGAIIVLMMWLYFSGIILMLGGQLNAVMSERETMKLRKKKGDATV